MNNTETTSPFYDAWVQTHQADLDATEQALIAGDFDAVGTLMEHSTLKMHASALAAKPGLWYFMPTTIEVMNAVRDLREPGTANAFFTMDAGPHVKVLVRAEEAEDVEARLGAIAGVIAVTASAPGPGVSVSVE